MDPHDIPAMIAGSSNRGADIDYGPRGPHHRKGVQLLAD
jgi:indolepyruvate decarboxylase